MEGKRKSREVNKTLQREGGNKELICRQNPSLEKLKKTNPVSPVRSSQTVEGILKEGRIGKRGSWKETENFF